MKLWYRQPANQWIEALPVGNGMLGAMVFGGVPYERLSLNHETLWSGRWPHKNWNNPEARTVLPDVRRLIQAEQYTKADVLARQMQGPFTQAYMPLGDLHLFAPHQAISNYQRELDLTTAVARVSYQTDAAIFTREIFASHPQNVIVIRLTCDQPGHLNLRATFTSPLRSHTTTENEALLLHGQAPAQVYPNYYATPQPVVYGDDTTQFCACLQADVTGGQVVMDGGGLNIEQADAVTLYLSMMTSYREDNTQPTADPVIATQKIITDALVMGYDAVLQAHQEDYQSLFSRVTLDLGGTHEVTSPTDVLLDEEIPSPELLELCFQYGRYLLIASARGTQAANLQGIWNPWIRPPWSNNYTLNINTQMNYWLAEPAALPECHTTLFNLIAKLSENGGETAQINYGARGWVAHHNTDLWGQTAPPGNFGDFNPVWSMWPMGGVWLCQHLWEHYVYGLDRDFLAQQAYPIMRGAATFCLDWLVESPAHDHKLVTMPSTSPENWFTLPDVESAAVSAASTMDMALIWDLFTNCIAASEILDTDHDFRAQLIATRARLLPPKIGQFGQLCEWSADWDRPDDQHRHISHVFGLHPGRQITRERTPALFDAARKSIEMRGDGGTGWALAWKINMWARLHEGNRAYQLLQRMLTLTHEATQITEAGGVYPNLLDAHPPFQIDGNFGVVAGMIEMLVQSHTGVMHLLPALPDAWANGALRGVRVRGGYTLHMRWADRCIVSVEIAAKASGMCRVYSTTSLDVVDQTIESYDEHTVSFMVEAGQTVLLVPVLAN